MMRATVFLGPTLQVSEALAVVNGDVDWRPPARRGDIYRAVQSGARVIGLIDGHFRSCATVSHKEVLWALHKGCRVFGAASMGALRAAELAAFGMVGVGAIFQDFSSGRLSRDDEVAVVHAPAGLDYLVASEALVNMRYTVAHALAAGRASTHFCAAFLEEATALHYPDRTYKAVVLRMEKARRLLTEDREAVDWLMRNRINQKARDAIDMLRALNDDNAPGVLLDFQDTYSFAQFRAYYDNPLIRHLA